MRKLAPKKPDQRQLCVIIDADLYYSVKIQALVNERVPMRSIVEKALREYMEKVS